MRDRLVQVSLSEEDYRWFLNIARQCAVPLATLLSSELASCAADDRDHDRPEPPTMLRVIQGGRGDG